jgi:limonene 1,2-monooxygenase
MTRVLVDGPRKFGIFLPTFHKIGVNPTLQLEHDLQLIEFADRLGYQEAWVGEHHSGGQEIVGSPEMFLVAAAERTRQIRLGTAVNSLSYHNPLMLAERLVLLDHLSRGRAMMGFGPGQLASDAHMMGIDPKDQRRIMHDAAEAIVALLNGERVTMETDAFILWDAHLQLLPYRLPTLECVVAALMSPSGPSLSGRLGIGMINLASLAAADKLQDHWEIASREAEEHGKEISRESWRLAAFMHLAETDEQAKRDCEYGFEQIWAWLGEIGPLAPLNSTTVRDQLAEVAENGPIIIGTPEKAIQVIRRLAEQSGGFGTFVMTMGDFASPAAQMRSVELFAQYVIPHFRGQLDAQRMSHDWVVGARDAEHKTVWKRQSKEAAEGFTKQYDEERAANLSS